jgi:uncharacterized protein YacL (UPF0231 family)
MQSFRGADLNSVELHFYRDSAGDPRARCRAPYELLGHFLESDVQSNIALCEEILAVLDRMGRDEITRWQQTGNAHTLFLGKKEARIEAEYDEMVAPCRLTLDQLRGAVTRWSAFLGAEHGSRTL